VITHVVRRATGRPVCLAFLDALPDVEPAQGVIDAFRAKCNSNRPHQSRGMAFPAERFTPRAPEERLPLHLPQS
jgi:hypothetical protein